MAAAEPPGNGSDTHSVALHVLINASFAIHEMLFVGSIKVNDSLSVSRIDLYEGNICSGSRQGSLGDISI